MDYDLCVDNKIIIHKSPQIYYFSIRIVFFVKNKIAIRLVYSRFILLIRIVLLIPFFEKTAIEAGRPENFSIWSSTPYDIAFLFRNQLDIMSSFAARRRALALIFSGNPFHRNGATGSDS